MSAPTRAPGEAWATAVLGYVSGAAAAYAWLRADAGVAVIAVAGGAMTVVAAWMLARRAARDGDLLRMVAAGRKVADHHDEKSKR